MLAGHVTGAVDGLLGRAEPTHARDEWRDGLV